MAKTLNFTVPAPTGGQVAPTYVRLYEAATAAGARAQVGTDVTLASLGYTGNPPETLSWVVAAIDGGPGSCRCMSATACMSCRQRSGSQVNRNIPGKAGAPCVSQGLPQDRHFRVGPGHQ